MFRKITKTQVEEQHLKAPRRRRIADHAVFKEKEGDTDARVNFPFHESIGVAFEYETGFDTREGQYGFYRYFKNDNDIESVRNWSEQRSNYIWIRDCLDCSVALDFNLKDAGVYTEIGLAEHKAKVERDTESIELLKSSVLAACNDLSLYADADYVCAVPPAPGKQFDLPTELAQYVGKRHPQLSFFDGLSFSTKDVSIKTVPLADKWDELSDCGLEVKGAVQGGKFVLIDDKYQSGVTAQFVASKLLESGAKAVYGLFVVKTWRDSDNS